MATEDIVKELGYQPFDADNHYYEAEDAFIRHIDPKMQKRCMQWAEVDGKKRNVTSSRYVGSLYRTGMGNRQLAVYSSLMDARNPQQLFRGLGSVHPAAARDVVVAGGNHSAGAQV